jgi:Ca2+-binding RTX toxin-like protein
MDLNGIENINFVALGGADNITVGDLTGTGVAQVAIDLSATLGTGTGDGSIDHVTVTGTGGNDTITVTGAGASVTVTGLPEVVNINGAEAANDVLTINAGAGNDIISAATLPAAIIGLTIDGGAGNDTITGSQGNDVLIGGDGNDFVNGGRGNDTAQLGAGDDTFVWNPGDGSDVVEGGDGTDTLQFNGANIAENIDITANGTRTRFTRDVANITMDLNSVEHVNFVALAGADNIRVGDLTGTGVNQVNIDLAGVPGSGVGDGAADNVTVNGTVGNDTINVVSSGLSIVVNGLPAQVTIKGADANLDALVVNGGAGNDTINASSIVAGRVNLTINGGQGNDTLIGSAGDDTFVWNPGDGSDTVDGRAGNDTLVFNGTSADTVPPEQIDISANGSHVTLTRNIGNVVMDVNGTETLDVNALGGQDMVTVNDLTGTDVSQVNIDLGAGGASDAPDGVVDTITINATNDDDVITIKNVGNGVVNVHMLDEATGVTRDVTISNFDATDKIVINGLGGDDIIDATGLTGMQLTANGGNGDDILIGSAGNDTLTGGAGDDTLVGNGGQDILDGGPGGNVILAPTSIPLLSQFMASSFVTASDSTGAMPVVDQPTSPPPLLAQPHA